MNCSNQNYILKTSSKPNTRNSRSNPTENAGSRMNTEARRPILVLFIWAQLYKFQGSRIIQKLLRLLNFNKILSELTTCDYDFKHHTQNILNVYIYIYNKNVCIQFVNPIWPRETSDPSFQTMPWLWKSSFFTGNARYQTRFTLVNKSIGRFLNTDH